jgi:uncharacterized membrane protein (UPF0127 family)
MLIKLKHKIITKEGKYTKSFLDRMGGLLISSNPRFLLFKTRFGIHTFFLKKPIDVLVLNKKFKVVKIKEDLKPNRLFFWNPKYFWVLELPKGLIEELNIQAADNITFDPKPLN